MGLFCGTLIFLLVISIVPVDGDYYYNYYTYDEKVTFLKTKKIIGYV